MYWPTEQARLSCEARHVEEELLAIGVYPEWRLGISPPQGDREVDLDITSMGESDGS